MLLPRGTEHEVQYMKFTQMYRSLVIILKNLIIYRVPKNIIIILIKLEENHQTINIF